jgi:hypothetical protein
MGLRVTNNGLERQFAPKLPWLRVESDIDVTGASYSMTRGAITTDSFHVPEDFTRQVEELHIRIDQEYDEHLKEGAIAMVQSVISSYAKQLEDAGLLVDREGKRQFKIMRYLLNESRITIQTREYRPYKDALGLDSAILGTVKGYEVVFVSQRDQSVVSAGLYVDMSGFVHIGVGDGWSAVDSPDASGKRVMDTQAMKEFYISHLLTLTNAGPVIRGTNLPSMAV